MMGQNDCEKGTGSGHDIGFSIIIIRLGANQTFIYSSSSQNKEQAIATTEHLLAT